jgi:L-threonylcarbamoyladenylate synthase
MQSLGDWADEIPTYGISLARDFWPGPMTLILKRSILAEDFVTGGQPTVGLRVPDHVVALALLSAFEKIGGKGIAAPSANRFGHVSPTTAQAVQEELGDYLDAKDQILDGGPSSVGVESTIIDCTSDAPRILRPGAITIEMIEQSTGLKVSTAETNIRVSGSLENHYAPQATVSLNRVPEKGEGFIAHEFQSAFPDAVSGKKDGIDAKGNPEYQGMDVSFAVATLTAAIQELKAELDSVEAELQTLKGN